MDKLELHVGFPPEEINNAAVSYVSYDSYVMNVGDAHHVDDCIPLVTYQDIRAMEVDLSTFRNIPGENDLKLRFRAPTDCCKKVIRTILKGLRENEMRGWCFVFFDISNIFVSPKGKVKFKNVVRVNVELDLLRDNYNSAYKIIRDIFPGKDEEVPPGIRHLLDMIKDDFDKREMFHIHGSLVSLVSMSLFYTAMYDHIRFKLPEDDLRDILTNLPYVDVWVESVKKNDLLRIPYEYNPGSYDVPADKPKQTCLNKRQKEILVENEESF